MRQLHQIFCLSLSFLALLFAPSFLSAQDEDLPKRGTLSGTYRGGNEGVVVPGQWAEKDVLSNDQPPITGSVSQINREEWMVRLFNNTEDRYSISVKVVQYDKNKRKTKNDNFSFTLKAGERAERKLRSRSNTDTAELELTNWKNLTNKNKK